MPAGDASSSLPPQGEQDMPVPDMGPMDAGMGEDPMAGDTGGLTGKVKEIADTAKQITPKDQDTLLKYARSLKDASEEAGEQGVPGADAGMGADPGMGSGAGMPPAQGGAPMMESVVFTKKQVRTINENFGEMNGELEREEKPTHTTKTDGKSNKVTPFDPPKKYRK